MHTEKKVIFLIHWRLVFIVFLSPSFTPCLDVKMIFLDSSYKMVSRKALGGDSPLSKWRVHLLKGLVRTAAGKCSLTKIWRIAIVSEVRIKGKNLGERQH
jgi:hypothetical protein